MSNKIDPSWNQVTAENKENQRKELEPIEDLLKAT